jgi:hypothetical protein
MNVEEFHFTQAAVTSRILEGLMALRELKSIGLGGKVAYSIHDKFKASPVLLSQLQGKIRTCEDRCPFGRA